jgi:O-antigen/teichoic acid export membrane protein
VIPVIKPFIAAFAELRKPELIRPGYLTASTSVVVFVAPILALVASLSEPIVALAFKPEWASASLLLAVLSVMGMLSLPAQPVASVALSLDKTRFNALQSAIGLCVKIPALFIGWELAGLHGFLIGLLIGAAAWSIAGAFIVRHLIGLSLKDQALALMRPFFGILALTGVVLLLRPMLNYDSALLLVLTSGVLASAGMIAYVIVVGIFWKMAGEPDGIERMVAGLIRKILRRPQPDYSELTENKDIADT